MTENHAQAENAAFSSRPASTCCCHRKETPRSEELQADLHRRLNRVIGQLGGVKTMIDDNRYCADVLTQLAAAEMGWKALDSRKGEMGGKQNGKTHKSHHRSHRKSNGGTQDAAQGK